MDEQKAREILSELNFVGNNLRCKDPSFFVNWCDTDTGIELDSYFEIEELEALVWWMKNKRRVDEISPD